MQLTPKDVFEQPMFEMWRSLYKNENFWFLLTISWDSSICKTINCEVPSLKFDSLLSDFWSSYSSKFQCSTLLILSNMASSDQRNLWKCPFPILFGLTIFTWPCPKLSTLNCLTMLSNYSVMPVFSCYKSPEVPYNLSLKSPSSPSVCPSSLIHMHVSCDPDSQAMVIVAKRPLSSPHLSGVKR